MLNNLIIFSGKPMRFGGVFNQIAEVLGIIIDISPKGRPCKMES